MVTLSSLKWSSSLLNPSTHSWYDQYTGYSIWKRIHFYHSNYCTPNKKNKRWKFPTEIPLYTEWIMAYSSLYPASINRQKVTLEEWVFVESALNMQCHIINNTLLYTAFSAILPAGYIYLRNTLRKKDLWWDATLCKTLFVYL